ncbi:MAG TPA: MlaD family protein [Caulobacteraceae bacterium]|nr:MlaD family protein [Caulobacteraceae bacterium]
MERSANYALVGVISTVLVIGVAVFVVWLAGFSFTHGYDTYDVRFQGPVTGLAKGAEVHFNGIKVGDVTGLRLDRRDTRFVLARIRVTNDVPIRQDSYATLEPLGITGVSYVQITAGTATRPLLKNTVPPGVVPEIGSRKSALSNLLQGGGYLVQRASETLDRLNRVLSDQNIQTISATMSDVQAFTAELRERKSIIDDAQKTVQSADQAVQQIRDLAKSSDDLVNGPGKQAMTKMADAANEVDAAAKELHGTLARLQGPTTTFAEQGLPRLTDDMASLKRATDDLDRLVNEVRADPRGVLGKPPAKEVEVKP